jgi:23S rRNA G2069 N7-methylase RlmK/C1962 C5-methylase RlmI
MTRSDELILHQSATLLVVNKPAGLATDAPEHADDLLRQVKRRVTQPVWVIHRLERDVAGVTVFSLHKPSNGVLAQGLETQQFARRVTALVRGAFSPAWTVHTKREANGVTLVEFDPKRSKLREVVAKLGDKLLAPLQLSAVELPSVGWVRAPLSGAQRRLITDLSDKTQVQSLQEQLLREAKARREALYASPETNAFRVVNQEADGMPGVSVDRYDQWHVVSFYQDEDSPALAEWRQGVCQSVQAVLGGKGVYSKIRRKQSNTLVDTRRDEVAPSRAVVGESTAQRTITVKENGVNYVVALGDGLSTGIFLDQRDNRQRIARDCTEKSLLNLFAYTGAFSVAAAHAGARQTLSVDGARAALSVLPLHLAANERSLDKHLAVCAEVFGWLQGAVARKDRYDVVVCDPPSYSAIKDGPRFSADRDWPSLAEKCARLVTAGGVLWVCTNHRGIYERRFKTMVLEGVARARRTVSSVQSLAVSDDFAPAPGQEPHLKTLRIVLQ